MAGRHHSASSHAQRLRRPAQRRLDWSAGQSRSSSDSPNFIKHQSASVSIRTGLFYWDCVTATSRSHFSRSDEGRPTLLVSLDLSAAFDMDMVSIWCRPFMDSILSPRPDTVCTHGLVLVSRDFMLCRCSPRILSLGHYFFYLTSTLSTIAESHQSNQMPYSLVHPSG